jgi:hypothetical protein
LGEGGVEERRFNYLLENLENLEIVRTLGEKYIVYIIFEEKRERVIVVVVKKIFFLQR